MQNLGDAWGSAFSSCAARPRQPGLFSRKVRTPECCLACGKPSIEVLCVRRPSNAGRKNAPNAKPSSRLVFGTQAGPCIRGEPESAPAFCHIFLQIFAGGAAVFEACMKLSIGTRSSLFTQTMCVVQIVLLCCPISPVPI